MTEEERRALASKIEGTQNEIREMEKVLDESWYRNLVKDGEEMVGGLYQGLITMPIATLGDFVQLLELRGKLQGVALYGGLITGRLDSLKQTLQQLKTEYDDGTSE